MVNYFVKCLLFWIIIAKIENINDDSYNTQYISKCSRATLSTILSGNFTLRETQTKFETVLIQIVVRKIPNGVLSNEKERLVWRSHVRLSDTLSALKPFGRFS
jgi:hypothetical protein